MRWINIFKRQAPQMPAPSFIDNWMDDAYKVNVREGVLALQSGKSVRIYDDGRGYELACDIKRQFILEYQKQLSEKIKISHEGVITVSLNKD